MVLHSYLNVSIKNNAMNSQEKMKQHLLVGIRKKILGVAWFKLNIKIF